MERKGVMGQILHWRGRRIFGASAASALVLGVISAGLSVLTAAPASAALPPAPCTMGLIGPPIIPGAYVSQFFAQPLQVKLTCSVGSPEGQTVGFQVTGGPGTASVTSPTATAGSDGVASMAVMAGSTGGPVQITATYPTSNAYAQQQVTFNLFVIGGGTPNPDCGLGGAPFSLTPPNVPQPQTNISGDNQIAASGSFFPQAVRVQVVCPFLHEPAGDLQVNFTQVGGTGSVTMSPANPVLTGSDGWAQVAVMAGNPGTVQLKATYVGDPPATPNSSFTFTLRVTGGSVADPNCGIPVANVSGNNQAARSGSFFAHAVSVQLVCSDGAPLTGQQVSFTQVGGTGTATTNPSSPVATGADGAATVQVFAGNPGTVTLRAQYGSGPPSPGNSVDFTLYVTS